MLLTHENADIRRRALAMLSAARDTSISRIAMDMLRDPDLGVRTEALLYVTREMRVDPLRQLEELGDFEDFSIRAGMAAFLASPGPSQNLDAARMLLSAMADSEGQDGVQDRLQAARVLSLVPGLFTDLLVRLIADPEPSVARQAIAAASVVMRDEVVDALLRALARPELTADAADSLRDMETRSCPSWRSAWTIRQPRSRRSASCRRCSCGSVRRSRSRCSSKGCCRRTSRSATA